MASRRPANGRVSPVNARRSRRARQRLDDARLWRWWLARGGERGWIPGEDERDD